MKWISIEDELPEVGTHVLLVTEYLSSGKPASDMFVGYMDEYGECMKAPDDDSYGWQFNDCVAYWTRLPDNPINR